MLRIRDGPGGSPWQSSTVRRTRPTASTARRAVLCEGWQPVRGETAATGRWLDAQRNSQAPQSGDTPAVA